MSNFLPQILQHKKQEVLRRKQQVSFAQLQSRLQESAPPLNFLEALNKEGEVAVIAEIKKASPSAGILREDFQPESIARTYERYGASAISVLTDSRFFQGDLSHLQKVRNSVKLPVLQKDFILDPYQVLEARAHGVDAILLIVAALSPIQLKELMAAAREWLLTTLIEVHDKNELETALSAGGKLIGINNRNLHTFEVSLDNTRDLIKEIPSDVLVVSESGIKNRQDVVRLGQLGVHAVLIGESLMRSTHPGAALQQMVGVRRWLR